MKILSRNSMMMVLLAVVFLAPGLAAICFYQHPQWLMGHSTNKGDFVKPSMKIKSLVSTEKKWHLVLWSPSGCDESCIQPLDQLVRIRLALGRRFYEVDQALLTGPYSKPTLSELLDVLQENKVGVLQLPRNEASTLYAYAEEARIFIANPAGFLVLSYATTVTSDDVYRDLKQLMSTNKS